MSSSGFESVCDSLAVESVLTLWDHLLLLTRGSLGTHNQRSTWFIWGEAPDRRELLENKDRSRIEGNLKKKRKEKKVSRSAPWLPTLPLSYPSLRQVTCWCIITTPLWRTFLLRNKIAWLYASELLRFSPIFKAMNILWKGNNTCE